MFSRREVLRALGALAASSRIPGLAAVAELPTRPLGRTGRSVVPLALGGIGALQYPGFPDPPDIVVRAVELGVTYLDTANTYGASQLNYGEAFRRMHITPSDASYNAALRERLFIVSKTLQRMTRDRLHPSDRTVVDDLKQSLTQMFGDGQGAIPDGAYLDCFEFQNVAAQTDVDQMYQAFDRRDDRSADQLGGLAGLVDFRDGTNLTGLNPGNKKYIRHIGITGHGSPILMQAMRRDALNLLDTLQITLNANDRLYLPNQYNAIPLALALNMGVTAMKVFSAGAMYALSTTQLYTGLGDPTSGGVPYTDLIRYPLSIPGVATAAIGIGAIQRLGPGVDQLVSNLAAAIVDPASRSEMLRIEQDVAYSSGRMTNLACQDAAIGLQQPTDVKATRDGDRMVVAWNTAIAGADPIRAYEVWSGNKLVAALPYAPQTSLRPFSAAIPVSELTGDPITVRASTVSPFPARRRW